MPKLKPTKIKTSFHPYQTKKNNEIKPYKVSLISKFFNPDAKGEYFKIRENLPKPTPQLTGTGYFPKEIALVNGYDKKLNYGTALSYIHSLKKNGTLPEKRKYWQGYMFSVDTGYYNYSVTTLIARVGVDNKVYPPGSEVASAQVDDDSALYSINVKTPFQRNRIGAELIRFMAERDVEFFVYSGQENNSSYRLLAGGANLIQYCVREGILNSTKVVGGCPLSPQLLYNAPA